MNKKLLALALVITIFVGLILTGCNKDKNVPGSKSPNPTATISVTQPAGTTQTQQASAPADTEPAPSATQTTTATATATATAPKTTAAPTKTATARPSPTPTATTPAPTASPAPEKVVVNPFSIIPAGVKPSLIYTVPMPGKYSDQVLLAGLQGLVSKTSSEQIYISLQTGINSISVIKNMGYTTKTGGSVWTLIPKYKNLIKGYILYSTNSATNSDPSVDIATSLAGQMSALIVDESIEAKVKELGIPKLLDVRGKDQNWLLNQQKYIRNVSRKIMINNYTYMGANLRDFAVANNAIFFTTEDGVLRDRFMKLLEPNAAVFGWNTGEFTYVEGANVYKGEHAFIRQTSVYQSFMIPSHNLNLSTLRNIRLNSAKQKASNDPQITAGNKHYVSFIMTDGDNINWIANEYNWEQWYGNPSRGSFKMGWGVAPVMLDVGAPALKWLYDNATPNDGFIIEISGMGYMRPRLYTEENLKQQLKTLNDYMGKIDCKYIQIADESGFSDAQGEKAYNLYAQQPNIQGMFFIGDPYHNFNGAIKFYNNKPLISSRYSLWRGFDTASTLAAKINSSAVNPKNASGYSVVSVHAWFESSPGVMGNAMDEVKKAVDLFDKNRVEVVTPQELAKLVKNNVVH